MENWYDKMDKEKRKEVFDKIKNFLKDEDKKTEIINKIAKEGLNNWFNQFANGEVQLNVKTLEIVGWSNIGGSSQENPINPYIGLIVFSQNTDWDDVVCDYCDAENCSEEQKKECNFEQVEIWVENQLDIDEILRSLEYDLFPEDYRHEICGGF